MKGPVARATLRTSAALGLRLLVQAGTLLVVARLLGPKSYGGFAGITALAVMLGTMSTFGTHLVLLREVAKVPSRRDAVLRYALSTTLICGGLLLVAYFSIARTVLHSGDVGWEVLLCIGLAELLLQPLLQLACSEHQALGRIAGSQLLVSSPLVLRLLVAALVWFSGTDHPLEAYALGYAGASVVALALGLRTLSDRWPALWEWRMPHRNELFDASGFAILNLTALGPSELDKTLAMRLLPLAAAGVYAASARVVGAAVLPVIALMLSSLPRLFREAGQSRGVRLLRWIFALSTAYGLIAASLLWAAAPLLERLFGPHYRGVAEVLRWLAIAVPALALRVAAGSTLMARGHPWLRAGFELVGLLVLCVATFTLVPNGMARDMPLALACSEWSMAVFGWVKIGLDARQSNALKQAG